MDLRQLAAQTALKAYGFCVYGDSGLLLIPNKLFYLLPKGLTVIAIDNTEYTVGQHNTKINSKVELLLYGIMPEYYEDVLLNIRKELQEPKIVRSQDGAL